MRRHRTDLSDGGYVAPRTAWGDPDLEGVWPSAYQIFEYACHEGNYSMRNTLSGSRADEQTGGGR